MRKLVLALASILFFAAPAAAQQASGPWANKMFQTNLNHDFGSVARGAQLKHSFVVKNPWSVPITITDVRVSCGCVAAAASKKVLQPLEEGSVEISMDGRRFSGAKSVTVYVTVGPTYVSTAVLSVSANARTDVAITPGDINFGVVAQGQQPSQSVEITYDGFVDWHVKEVVKPADAPLSVAMEEIYRKRPNGSQAGKVVYRLTAKLSPDAAGGVLKHDLVLKTNDPNSPTLVVSVDANVQAALRVAPSQVNLGALKLGDPKINTFKIQVMGNRPFRVTDIKSDGKEITLDGPLPQQELSVHTLTLRCQPIALGELKRIITVVTDLDKGTSVTVTLQASASQ